MTQMRPMKGLGAMAGVTLLLATSIYSAPARAEDHDLVIRRAPDVTSSESDYWKSLDIKIGAAFGDPAVPDIVKRGTVNHVYARFCINGVHDFEIDSGDAQVQLHYRDAIVESDPYALPAPGEAGSDWIEIGTLSAEYDTHEEIFAIGMCWPADELHVFFPSGTTRSVAWDVPPGGEHFHVRAEVVYRPSTGVVDERPGDNVAVSLYGSVSGLIDVVLVQDTSGSMGYYMYDDKPYVQHAISRASAFVYGLDEPTNRFSVIAFSSRFPDGVNNVYPADGALVPATTLHREAAVAEIAGLTAGGATPLGAAMQRAIDILLAGEDDIARKKVILLLSDGYENQGALRACDGADPSAPCVGPPIRDQLQANNIRVFSIALGTAAWGECLDCLATQSEGNYFDALDPGITTNAAYLYVQEAYTDDDLYSVDLGLSGGGDDSFSVAFEGVGDVLFFILAWDDLSADLNLQLKAPDGAWADAAALPNATVNSGDGYSVARIEDSQAGEWGYRVTGDDGERYLVAVRSQRVGVRLALDARSSGQVGDPIEVVARLTRYGKPIVDASLNASVAMPEQMSLDSTLREMARGYMLKNKAVPIDPNDFKQNSDLWPRAVFIKKITEGKPETLGRTRTVSVPLSHVGEGVYKGTLKESTQIAGGYDVTVVYRHEGTVRTQSRPVWLKPGPIEQSLSTAEILEIKAADGAPQWLLRVYPVDGYGNAVVDAAMLKQVEVSIDGGHVDKPPEIAYDSGLQQVVIPEPDRAPKLTGAAIGGKRLKIIEEIPPAKLNRSLLIVILILIVLVLVAWRLRRKTPTA